jgi:hypothetical protein
MQYDKFTTFCCRIYVNNVPTPFDFSAEGELGTQPLISNWYTYIGHAVVYIYEACLSQLSPLSIIGTSSLDTIISSSQSGSSKGSENENQEPCAFANHGANGIWCDLNEELASKLSPSIISLASFDGDYTTICTFPMFAFSH